MVKNEKELNIILNNNLSYYKLTAAPTLTNATPASDCQSGGGCKTGRKAIYMYISHGKVSKNVSTESKIKEQNSKTKGKNI